MRSFKVKKRSRKVKLFYYAGLKIPLGCIVDTIFCFILPVMAIRKGCGCTESKATYDTDFGDLRPCAVEQF